MIDLDSIDTNKTSHVLLWVVVTTVTALGAIFGGTGGSFIGGEGSDIPVVISQEIEQIEDDVDKIGVRVEKVEDAQEELPNVVRDSVQQMRIDYYDDQIFMLEQKTNRTVGDQAYLNRLKRKHSELTR